MAEHLPLVSEHVIRRSSKVTQSTQTEDANEEIEKEEFERRLLGALPLLVPRPGCGYKRYHEELWPLNTRLYVHSKHKQAKIYFETPEALWEWQRRIGEPEFPLIVVKLGKIFSKLILFGEEEDSEDSSSSEQTKKSQ